MLPPVGNFVEFCTGLSLKGFNTGVNSPNKLSGTIVIKLALDNLVSCHLPIVQTWNPVVPIILRRNLLNIRLDPRKKATEARIGLIELLVRVELCLHDGCSKCRGGLKVLRS